LRPLKPRDLDRIIDHGFAILDRVGMADAPHWLENHLEIAGARRRADGRITFDRSLVEKAISRAARRVSLPGFSEDRGLQIGGGFVHIGTGGAAVHTLDGESGEYRESGLTDLYDMMRVLDHCQHIHYGVRPLVARDMPTPFELDINTAYACLSATAKPIGISFDNAGNVAPVTQLFDLALGAEGAFRRRPFCMAIIVHVVPPLRYAAEGVEVMAKAITSGMPLQICSAGQAGATSPASLAGALAQGLAECLAGLMVVDALAPGHPCIFAFMPFISDLRTGAMSGGGGEAAIANAAAAQLLLHLGLPSTVSAGMTDSKIADAQAGYEKGYSVALAAQAGADMINLSVGMLGSIMVASPEALVIDNEMCGAILRTVRGIEVSDDHLDLDDIERVVTGEGHYLGEAQTLDLMKTEYVYPRLGDRLSVSDWVDAGRRSIWDRARDDVANILAGDGPKHLGRREDRAIRERFPIRLRIEEKVR
jgi:trimethylamine--corrinoid protein Co-methyltransferase